MRFELVPIDGQHKLTVVHCGFRPDSESLMTVSQASRGCVLGEDPLSKRTRAPSYEPSAHRRARTKR